MKSITALVNGKTNKFMNERMEETCDKLAYKLAIGSYFQLPDVFCFTDFLSGFFFRVRGGFWAAALKGPMTYAFTHRGNFSFFFFFFLFFFLFFFFYIRPPLGPSIKARNP